MFSHLQQKMLLIITALITQNTPVRQQGRRSCDVTTAVLSVITKFTACSYYRTRCSASVAKNNRHWGFGALLMCTLNRAGVESKINQEVIPGGTFVPIFKAENTPFPAHALLTRLTEQMRSLASSFINVFMGSWSVGCLDEL